MDDGQVNATDTDSQSGKTMFRMQISLRVNFPPAEVAEFISRPEVVDDWLAVAEDAGVLCQGLRSQLDAVHEVLAEPGEGSGTVGTERGASDVWLLPRRTLDASGFCLSVTRRSGSTRRPSGSNIRFVHVVETREEIDLVVRAWQAARNRLALYFVLPERERRRVRQAVIVVHGIGEQMPGETLREFCAGVFPDAWAERPYVRPDYVSDLFELRTASLAARDGRPTTDVYELYWAHLVRDTTAGQAYSWAARMLTAPSRQIPTSLKVHVWVLRATAILAVVMVVVLMATGAWSAAAIMVGAIAVVPFLWWTVLRLTNHYVIQFAGDAARYLEPRASNIRARQTIREEGVRLLERLHERGRYDRIIVFGHSLGSVIAYDIVCRAWTRRFRTRTRDVGRTSSRALARLEAELNPAPGKRQSLPGRIPSMQNQAWHEYRRNGFDWLVSDLVTAGSPLAHANWLLNAGRSMTFKTLIDDRTLCACPPQTETRAWTAADGTPVEQRVFTFTHSLRPAHGGKAKSVLVPHHAGVFAVTRWTNLYFAHRGVMGGDPVGGPVGAMFGEWVDDRELPHPGGGPLGFVHSSYLKRVVKRPEAPGNAVSPADAVRDALRLRFPISLDEYLDRAEGRVEAETSRPPAPSE